MQIISKTFKLIIWFFILLIRKNADKQFLTKYYNKFKLYENLVSFRYTIKKYFLSHFTISKLFHISFHCMKKILENPHSP